MDKPEDIVKIMASFFKEAMSTLPTVVGNEIVNFSKERFTAQDWLDKASTPWEKRISTKDSGRAILTKTGRLKRSIRVVNTTTDSVSVGSDVPYAKVHNEGFNGTVQVKSYTRKKTKTQRIATMKSLTPFSGINASRAIGAKIIAPHGKKMNVKKRQFLGPSQTMLDRLKKVASKHIFRNMQLSNN